MEKSRERIDEVDLHLEEIRKLSDSDIQKISLQEKEKYIAKIDAIILEGDPTQSGFRKSLKQRFLASTGTTPLYDPTIRSFIQEEYSIGNNDFAVNIREHSGYYKNLDLLTDTLQKDYIRDYKYRKGRIAYINEKNHEGWINLKILRVNNDNTEYETVIHIDDRYVIKQKRGEGIGKAMLDLVDCIGKSFGTGTIIFCELEAEEEQDADLLLQSHQKRGYKTWKDWNLTIAQKTIT